MSSLSGSESLLRRICDEFLETPDLRLTPWQFQRLWRLDVDECRRVIRHLVAMHFLSETSDGLFVRRQR